MGYETPKELIRIAQDNWADFAFADEGEVDRYCDAIDAGDMETADAIVAACYERLNK